MLEEELCRRVEGLLGVSLADLALASLRKAALLGLPIGFAKRGGRAVEVSYERRRAVFRVTVAQGLEGRYAVCLRLYTADCGRVASVAESGEVRVEVESIPGYLSSPGELYSGAVADVWTARFREVLRGALVPVPRYEVPPYVAEAAGRLLGSLASSLEVFHLPSTGDYALGAGGVYPLWVGWEGLLVSVSEVALRELLGGGTAPAR